ncbi:SPFH domain, Band 7 family protein [Thermoplasmatales archaeon BRNA1]|nr:SPFH domain, Band 7 family protein [Thermoplasmatales archaeon BRNA1]
MDSGILIGVAIIVLVLLVVCVLSGVKIVNPYEQGIYTRLGKFIRVLNPGLNFVCPLINEVVKLDLRTEVMDVPKQEVITKDNSPVNVDAIIYIKVTDPKNAFFEVTNYRLATVNLAQTTLRSVIGQMELDQILSSRENINVQLRDTLDEATDKWGVRVENVEIKEVDPAAKVKGSMEEQTSAERKRRAAILEADGQKRAAILMAEGERQSAILKAEGERQSTILKAEGKRTAIILEAQGDAQKLRIMSVGAAAMDSKALSVLSMETLKSVGQGESSKIFFPMEVTRLVEGISDYVGAAKNVPDRQISDTNDIKQAVGDPDDVLGPIPSPQDVKKETDSFKESIDAEITESDGIAEAVKLPKV